MGLAALAVAAFAGGAYAATQTSGPNTRQAFLNDVAKRLNVTPQQLTAALNGATIDQLQAEVKSGKLTQAQANALEQHLKQNGTNPAVPFGFFGPGGGPGFAPPGFGPPAAWQGWPGSATAPFRRAVRGCRRDRPGRELPGLDRRAAAAATVERQVPGSDRQRQGQVGQRAGAGDHRGTEGPARQARRRQGADGGPGAEDPREPVGSDRQRGQPEGPPGPAVPRPGSASRASRRRRRKAARPRRSGLRRSCSRLKGPAPEASGSSYRPLT